MVASGSRGTFVLCCHVYFLGVWPEVVRRMGPLLPPIRIQSVQRVRLAAIPTSTCDQKHREAKLQTRSKQKGLKPSLD